MNQQFYSPNGTTSDSKVSKKQKKHPGDWLNRPIAVLAAMLLTPVWGCNAVAAKVRGEGTFTEQRKIDALGREVKITRFKCGMLASTAVLLDILAKRVSFVGASLNHTVDYQSQKRIARDYQVLPGLTSLQDVHAQIGLDASASAKLMQEQLQGSFISTLGIAFKALLNKTFFSDRHLSTPKQVPVFGLKLNNVTMQRAVSWVVRRQPLNCNMPANLTARNTQVGYFINAHSINTLSKDSMFKSCLQRADGLFADGSGMRLAAKKKGFGLLANLNGTDMLPEICKQAAADGKSIYLLGGGEGIAKKAAKRLKQVHPALKIAGTHNGFFNFKDKASSEAMVAEINATQADIVLVGFGSPHQELWCEQFANALHCQTVMAVGGLFDFFSGAIPRAPLFMREIGMEWVWRLIQEPKTKFKRYVIGTPEFLIRTFLIKQA